VTCVKWELVLVCLETMLILAQGRCTVCTKREIGLEIVLGAPDAPTRSSGCRFSSFGDSVNLGAI
jgi:hypothetical protein